MLVWSVSRVHGEPHFLGPVGTGVPGEPSHRIKPGCISRVRVSVRTGGMHQGLFCPGTSDSLGGMLWGAFGALLG